jgi:uncharacterized protein YkwD
MWLLTACGAPIADEDEPAPPDAGVEPPTLQQRALIAANQIRDDVGLPHLVAVADIEEAAQSHAEYALADGRVDLSVHEEVEGNPGYTGRDFGLRMNAAGYYGRPFSEVIHFVGDPERAIADWRDTVFHRIPFVHPNARDAGYGVATDGVRSVDVMNFGGVDHGYAAVPYPPDGATEVPRAWSGLELPQPPVPPDGFPSGPVITFTFNEGTIATLDRHQLFGESGTEIPHQFLSPDTPELGVYLNNTVALYPNEPLAPGATVRVRLGGQMSFSNFEVEWSFSTCADCP